MRGSGCRARTPGDKRGQAAYRSSGVETEGGAEALPGHAEKCGAAGGCGPIIPNRAAAVGSGRIGLAGFHRGSRQGAAEVTLAPVRGRRLAKASLGTAGAGCRASAMLPSCADCPSIRML